MAKAIVLCADDYGFYPAVSQGIRHLLEAGRLTATSVMSSMPDWTDAAKPLLALKQQKNNFDVGLHLNFTDGKGLTSRFRAGFPPLKHWLIRTHANLANVRQLEQEMAAQLERFSEYAGCLPDFIDGHQHVHQFPLFRRALVNLINSRGLHDKLWLRTTFPSCGDDDTQIKRRIITMTGARKFAGLCNSNNFHANNSFAGITNFKLPYTYREHMQHWLRECADKTLIMCHPGLNSSTIDDSIAQFRKIEYDYLVSDDFAEDCAAFGVEIKVGSDVFQTH